MGPRTSPRGADADGVWMHRPYPPKDRIIVVLTLKALCPYI